MKSLKFLSALLLVCIGTACNSNENGENVPRYGQETYDSTALHVALVTNRDCLPVYYAARTGLFDSLGVKVQISSYRSQMDCDTALLGRFTDCGFADRQRLAHYGNKANGLIPKWSGTNHWALYVCGTLRVKDIKALKGKTIGISRNSAEYRYLLQLLDGAGLKVATDIYKPQINDWSIRTKMLSGNQIDATILSWPYTSLASAMGHRRLAGQKTADGNGCFVLKDGFLKEERQRRLWALFEKGYRMAQDSLKIKGAPAYSYILQKDYGLPQAVADTISY